MSANKKLERVTRQFFEAKEVVCYSAVLDMMAF